MLALLTPLVIVTTTPLPLAAQCELIDLWGASGHLPGQINQPFLAGADSDGNIVVLDSGNRVQRFDKFGRFINGFAADYEDLQRPGAVAPDGSIYVLNSVDCDEDCNPGCSQSRVQKLNPSGEWLDEWTIPPFDECIRLETWIATDFDGNVYVADDDGRIGVRNSSGQFVRTINMSSDPRYNPSYNGWIGPDGSIFSGEDDGLFQFDSFGAYIKEWECFSMRLNESPISQWWEILSLRP